MTLLAEQATWGSAEESGSARQRKLSIHGAPVDLSCGYGPLEPQIEQALGMFTLQGHEVPAATPATSGTIQPYDYQALCPHLSLTARRCAAGAANHDGEPLELYQEDERYWVVDERWGMAEINLLRGQWRSWVLPEPELDPVRCAELAVVWPLAQLLRARGLHLVPAVSAVRDGWAVLILGSTGLEPELVTMMEAGYRLIGQRWTVIREEEARLAMLQMPGRVERTTGPRAATPVGRASFLRGDAGWVDLAGQRGCRQTHAFCDAVLALAPGRRPHAELRELSPSQALPLLRQIWPMVELHPNRRFPLLPGKLARHCRCGEAQLSRDPREILALLDRLHAGSANLPLEIGPEMEEGDADDTGGTSGSMIWGQAPNAAAA